jgi:predicted transcriptional regulator
MSDIQSEPKLVRDLMTVGVVTCSPETPVREIAQAILEKDIEAVVVLDPDGQALGVVGQDELIQTYAMGNYEAKIASDVMKDGIPQIPPDIPIPAAAQIMQDQGIRVFYLTHHAAGIEYPAAVISYKHFIKHFASQSDDEIKDLGIKAERKAPVEKFIEQREANKKQNTQLR